MHTRLHGPPAITALAITAAAADTSLAAKKTAQTGKIDARTPRCAIAALATSSANVEAD